MCSEIGEGESWPQEQLLQSGRGGSWPAFILTSTSCFIIAPSLVMGPMFSWSVHPGSGLGCRHFSFPHLPFCTCTTAFSAQALQFFLKSPPDLLKFLLPFHKPACPPIPSKFFRDHVFFFLCSDSDSLSNYFLSLHLTSFNYLTIMSVFSC